MSDSVLPKAANDENGYLSAPALQKHYRVRELASLWGFSDNTIIRLFASEPGVIRLESGALKRKYTTLSIPGSVASRVHERLGHKSLEADFATGKPIRILRLRDLESGEPRQARKILKLHATK